MQASTRSRSRELLSAIDAVLRQTSELGRTIPLMGLLLCADLLTPVAAHAQTSSAGHRATASEQQALRTSLNNSTLMLAASRPDASYLAMAHDMAAAMGNSTEIRLVPLAASGGVENLRDLVLLRGLDMAIVPANVLAQMKSAEALLGAGLRQRVAYVTQLYADEVHLLVGRGVSTIEGLKRSRIAVPPDDGTAEFTARDVLERLGIEMEIVRLHPTAAIEQIRSGELAAGLFVGAKPLQLVAHLPKDGRLRLMGLPYPKTMEEGYLPAAFRAEDYPALVPPGTTIETVATSAVLMANIARGYEESVRRVAKFVPLFFDSVAELTPLGQNPKWKELNLAAPLPGWTRHPAAEEWLNTAKEKQRAVLQKSFDDFLLATRPPGSPTLTPAERKKLFEGFIDWTRQSVRAARGSERP